MTRTTTLAFLATALCLPTFATAETIIALKEDASPYLISFDSTAPQTLTGRLNIIGLPTLPTKAMPVSVDFRPNGGLYLIVQGLPTATDCALYTVSTASGFASPVGNTTFSCAGVGDADLDPKADQMRVIHDTQNYRLTLGTGFSANVTKSNGNTVAYKTGVADPHEGQTPNIVALAYDQNVASAANTTLFGVDAATDGMVIVGSTAATTTTSVDAGELTTFGPGLGVPVTNAAFDISGSPAGTGYLYVWEKAAAPNANGFYTVALTGGSFGTATFVGPVGDGSGNILSLTTVPGTIFLPPPSTAAPLDDGGAAPWSLFGLLAAVGLWRRRSVR